ncbi:hypothetical protein D3C86_1115660 [compost metagenome]
MATPAQTAIAGQPDLATPEFAPQFRDAGGATRRTGRAATATTPTGAVAARRRRRTLADDHRRAPGRRVVDRLDGVVLSAAATTGRARLELAVADLGGQPGLALAGTPDQCLLCTGAGGLGTDLCRLRFQSVPEPAHRAGGLGYRTGVPPNAPASGQCKRCPVDRRDCADAAHPQRMGHRTGPLTRQPTPPGPAPEQPGLQGQHQDNPRTAALQEPGIGHALPLWRRPTECRSYGRRQDTTMVEGPVEAV